MKSRVEKRMRVMGKEGKRKDRTACKGHTAQFTSVKETIWLQFLLLSHSELLNSLFVHVGHVHVCICVFLYLCLCEYVHVDKCVDMCFCICVCLAFWQPVLQMHRVVIV